MNFTLHDNTKIEDVQGLNKYSDKITLVFENGSSITFQHYQDCCESVSARKRGFQL